MVALLVTALFAAIFAGAMWAIAATLAPELGRIGFLLRHGALVDAPLPQPQLRAARRTAGSRVPAAARLREVA